MSRNVVKLLEDKTACEYFDCKVIGSILLITSTASNLDSFVCEACYEEITLDMAGFQKGVD